MKTWPGGTMRGFDLISTKIWAWIMVWSHIFSTCSPHVLQTFTHSLHVFYMFSTCSSHILHMFFYMASPQRLFKWRLRWSTKLNYYESLIGTWSMNLNAVGFLPAYVPAPYRVRAFRPVALTTRLFPSKTFFFPPVSVNSLIDVRKNETVCLGTAFLTTTS